MLSWGGKERNFGIFITVEVTNGRYESNLGGTRWKHSRRRDGDLPFLNIIQKREAREKSSSLQFFNGFISNTCSDIMVCLRCPLLFSEILTITDC